MTHRKPLRLAAALGFAASLACTTALADQPRSGGYEEQEGTQQQEQVRPGVGQQVRPEEGAEARAGDVGEIGQIDKNKDDMISEDEYREWRESVFGKLDADKNGELTELEYIVMVPAVTPLDFTPKQLANRFKQLDIEDKGKVSEDEYIDVTEEGFKKADTDGDGKISLDELQTYISERG